MRNQSQFQQICTEHRCFLAVEPSLSELLSDPMTVALMAADHVDRSDLDRLIAGARGRRDRHVG
jgi:hypothetical protein